MSSKGQAKEKKEVCILGSLAWLLELLLNFFQHQENLYKRKKKPSSNLALILKLSFFLLHLGFFWNWEKLRWSQKNHASTRLQIWSWAQARHVFCSIWAFLNTKRISDGAKRQKAKLGPNFEFGAGPKLGFFFVAPSELLWTEFFLALKKTQLQQKKRSQAKMRLFFFQKLN